MCSFRNWPDYYPPGHYLVSKQCVAWFNKAENKYILVGGKKNFFGINFHGALIQETEEGAYEFGPALNTARYDLGCIQGQDWYKRSLLASLSRYDATIFTITYYTFFKNARF